MTDSEKGTAFISVRDVDKARAVSVATHLQSQASISSRRAALRSSAASLQSLGRVVNKVLKAVERSHYDSQNGDVQLVIATAVANPRSISDARRIRQTALALGVVYYIVISALPPRLKARNAKDMVRSLRELHAMNRA